MNSLLRWFLLCFMMSGMLAVVHAADKVNLRVLAEGLQHPWSMAFLPDGRMLVTERPGQLKLIDPERNRVEEVRGLPSIRASGQGGLLDVVLHPDYANNGWIYFSYASSGSGNDSGAGSDIGPVARLLGSDTFGTEVGRARLRANQLVDWQTLFVLQPKTNRSHHFGSRLVFDRDGYLFITLGDRGERDRSQDLNDHAGSVIRLHDDGRIPVDNPFVGRSDVRPEIYSYGHRNIQGAVLHPQTGQLWTHEHGPQGGDEINIIRPAENYGWPVISYGAEYGIGIPVGDTHKPGMQQPLHYWVPSIAPSGMTFYDADKFPQWKGNLFVGSLKFRLLVRLVIRDDKVVEEQRLLQDQLGRIRDVRVGPDGYLYLLSDARNGKLARLEPLP